MHKHYPNSIGDGSFSREEIEKGYIALHTDYTCVFCGRVQSVAQMGGYGGSCIKCGKNSRQCAGKARGSK
jgi:transcription elongation factor Elf1